MLFGFTVRMKIAAFNVKNLGVRKLNKDIVRNNLIKVSHETFTT